MIRLLVEMANCHRKKNQTHPGILLNIDVVSFSVTQSRHGWSSFWGRRQPICGERRVPKTPVEEFTPWLSFDEETGTFYHTRLLGKVRLPAYFSKIWQSTHPYWISGGRFWGRNGLVWSCMSLSRGIWRIVWGFLRKSARILANRCAFMWKTGERLLETVFFYWPAKLFVF